MLKGSARVADDALPAKEPVAVTYAYSSALAIPGDTAIMPLTYSYSFSSTIDASFDGVVETLDATNQGAA